MLNLDALNNRLETVKAIHDNGINEVIINAPDAYYEPISVWVSNGRTIIDVMRKEEK